MGTSRSNSNRTGSWCTRWAAGGAAISLTIGAGGILVAGATNGPAGGLVPITPLRILDTRDPVNVGLAGPFVSPTPQDLVVLGSIPTSTGLQSPVPPRATAVSLNVTVVSPTKDGYLAIRPADAVGAPTTSNLNFLAGASVPNAVTVALPTTGADTGKIEITYDAYGVAGATAEVLIDITGYYVPTGSGGPAGVVVKTRIVESPALSGTDASSPQCDPGWDPASAGVRPNVALTGPLVGDFHITSISPSVVPRSLDIVYANGTTSTFNVTLFTFCVPAAGSAGQPASAPPAAPHTNSFSI